MFINIVYILKKLCKNTNLKSHGHNDFFIKLNANIIYAPIHEKVACYFCLTGGKIQQKDSAFPQNFVAK